IGRTDEDTVPEISSRPISVRQDVWVLGTHRVGCGDSSNADEVQRLLNGVVPKIMDTDPPYGTATDPSWRERSWRGARSTGKVQGDDRSDWRQVWDLFLGDVSYVWHAGNKADVVAASLQAANFEIRYQLIWA